MINDPTGVARAYLFAIVHGKLLQYLFSVQKQEKKTNQFGAEEQRPKGVGFRQNVATGRGNGGSELNVDDR